MSRRRTIHRLTVTVHCDEQLDLLAAAVRRPIEIELKMNSDMNRLGFRPAAYGQAWKRVSALAAVGRIGLITHFANADDGAIDWQIDAFDSATRDLPGTRSLSNSAAVLWHPRAHRDWVRPGTILYSASPTGRARHIADLPLAAVMTLESRIIGVQTSPPARPSAIIAALSRRIARCVSAWSRAVIRVMRPPARRS